MRDEIAVKKFGVFHIFPFSFEYEVEFSQELFENLGSNSEIKGILRMKTKENDAILKNDIIDLNYCNNLSEYFKRNRRIFSPHYFDQEKNFRLFLPDIELVDTFGNHKKVSINTLIDKRGFGIINFFIEYIYDNPISIDKVLEELYAPHKGYTIIRENARRLNFENEFLYYCDKIIKYIPRNALKSKDNYCNLTREEIKNYYEPYAFTIIDDLHTEKKIMNDNELIMAFLPVLLWEEEKGKIRDYKKKTIENRYKDISHKKRYLTLLSRESTLLIDKNGKLPVNSSDVITYSINIEMLMLQKLILILYDHKVDAMLVQLRNKKISPSIIVDIREKVQKDLEDLFDIRIKKYQRGKDIVDVGQEILKLKDFVQEVLSKMNTLDNLIALKHNIYIEKITVLLTLLGLVIVIFNIVLSIIPPAYKIWLYGFYGIILIVLLYCYIQIKKV